MAKSSKSLGSFLLRQWRDRNELTQNEAALKIGVDFVQVSKFERGRLKPGRENAVRISQATEGEVPVESWGIAAPRSVLVDDSGKAA